MSGAGIPILTSIVIEDLEYRFCDDHIFVEIYTYFNYKQCHSAGNRWGMAIMQLLILRVIKNAKKEGKQIHNTEVKASANRLLQVKAGSSGPASGPMLPASVVRHRGSTTRKTFNPYFNSALIAAAKLASVLCGLKMSWKGISTSKVVQIHVRNSAAIILSTPNCNRTWPSSI